MKVPIGVSILQKLTNKFHWFGFFEYKLNSGLIFW